MKEVRCPECGYRLKTNECPICLKRVPFPLTLKQSGGRVQQKGKIKVSFPKTAPARKKHRTGDPKWKVVSVVVALVLAFARGGNSAALAAAGLATMGVDVDRGRQPRHPLNAFIGRGVQANAHRHPLYDLGEVAGGVVGRQQGEL